MAGRVGHGRLLRLGIDAVTDPPARPMAMVCNVSPGHGRRSRHFAGVETFGARPVDCCRRSEVRGLFSGAGLEQASKRQRHRVADIGAVITGAANVSAETRLEQEGVVEGRQASEVRNGSRRRPSRSGRRRPSTNPRTSPWPLRGARSSACRDPRGNRPPSCSSSGSRTTTIATPWPAIRVTPPDGLRPAMPGPARDCQPSSRQAIASQTQPELIPAAGKPSNPGQAIGARPLQEPWERHEDHEPEPGGLGFAPLN